MLISPEYGDASLCHSIKRFNSQIFLFVGVVGTPASSSPGGLGAVGITFIVLGVLAVVVIVAVLAVIGFLYYKKRTAYTTL